MEWEVRERFYDELRGSKINVCYAIDKNTCSIYSELSIMQPDGYLEGNIDAVIVTAVHVYNDVEKKLSERLTVPIISTRFDNRYKLIGMVVHEKISYKFCNI